ncbi:MAG TPA: translation initiation factor [Bacteroidetes bacterium]|nr:translation initiation factor Sui1 [bacterium BMS3Bbin04]HDO64993.1 translation initiation factor [Bacteroidota bacterium]HEX04118.1 translation initiation factor [Bacteroidota bacterium]
MAKSKRTGGLVYSTGRVEPTLEEETAPVPSGNMEAVLRIEKKGRRGKTVTVVEIHGVNPEHAKNLGKKLKNACGVGGTTKGTVVELQGDQRVRARELLVKEGLVIKGG